MRLGIVELFVLLLFKAANRCFIYPERNHFCPRTNCDHSDVHVHCLGTNPKKGHGIRSAKSLS